MDDTPGSSDPTQLAEENARLRAELEQARVGRPRSRIRGVLTAVLIVLTTICVVASTIGIWTQRTIVNTDRYVALLAPLAEDRVVTGALASRITDEVATALDIEGRVEDALQSIPRLPEQAELLAGPIAAGARNLIRREVDQFLASDAFAELWANLNRAAHEKVLALLEGDYDELPNVSISGGEVRLNLVPVVAEVIRRIAQHGLTALGIDVSVPEIPTSSTPPAAIQQLASVLGVSLPEDFGQVTIMSADDLESYQDTLRLAKRLVGALFLLSLVLIAVTILVARDRRRAVIWLGVAITIGLVLGGVLLRRIEANIVDAIDAPAGRAAAQDVFARVTTGLRGAGLTVALVALVAALIAYLIGRPAWFVRAAAWVERVTSSRPGGSELEVWVAGHADAVRVGGAVVAVLVLFLTGIDWIPVAVVAVLFGLLLWGVSIADQRAGAASASD